MSRLLISIALSALAFCFLFYLSREAGLGASSVLDISLLVIASLTAAYVNRHLTIWKLVLLFLVCFAVCASLAVFMIYTVFGDGF